MPQGPLLAPTDDFADWTAIFPDAQSGNGGRWDQEDSGSTPSSATGPGSNNVLAFAHTETSSAGTAEEAGNAGTVEMAAAHIPDEQTRVLRVRLCIQGDFGSGSEGLSVQARAAAGDEWAQAAFATGWPFSNSRVEGDSVTNDHGATLAIVAAGGWADLSAQVPDDATQLRLVPLYVFEPGDDTYQHDIAVAELQWSWPDPPAPPPPPPPEPPPPPPPAPLPAPPTGSPLGDDAASPADIVRVTTGRGALLAEMIVERVTLGAAVVIDDITTTVLDGSATIDRESGRLIPTSASLSSRAGSGDAEYWAATRVRLGQKLTDEVTGDVAYVPMGVYSATTLTISREADPPITAVELLDCLADLDTQLAEPYVGIGLVADTLADQCAAARLAVGFDVGGLRWEIAYEWPRGTTRLQVVTDTLIAHGWRQPWTDRATGALMSTPLGRSAAVVAEISHEGPGSVLSTVRPDITVDLAAPNEWVVVSSEPDLGLRAERRRNLARGPASEFARSGRRQTHVVSVDAATGDALAVVADRYAVLGTAGASLREVFTAPFPVAWHDERIIYGDETTAPVTCEVCSFSLPLNGEGDTRWTLGPEPQ